KIVQACEGNTARLYCDLGTISVTRANYGRTDCWVCSHGIQEKWRVSNTNCYHASSFAILSFRCNGKAQCEIPATNAVFSDPCRGIIKYLEVFYDCKHSTSECLFNQFTIFSNKYLSVFFLYLDVSYECVLFVNCTYCKLLSYI
uniref:SUEL-type lectin domain-containing protein n=1 Tax=Esox lucius TaxID=8010 RepID=A0AAY5KFY7_ESOLU